MHIDGPVQLDAIELNTSWQICINPIDCTQFELTGDVNWYWCTAKDGANRKVAAFSREVIFSRAKVGASTEVCWVKGEQVGMLYRKCTK